MNVLCKEELLGLCELHGKKKIASVKAENILLLPYSTVTQLRDRAG